jgi:hypothetical protein
VRFPRRGLASCAVALALVACSDDDSDADPTTTTEPSAPVDTVAPDDPALTPLVISADDLPDGFAPSEDVDDTITAFCAGQDATAGLAASGRAVAGFTRTPPGASVIEVAFRFEGDGAEQFVTQAEELLTSCHEVPDATGLAFSYEPLSVPVAATLERVETSAGRFGTSVGAGNLTVDIAVVQQGDLGALVAVLALDAPRTELDALAQAAFQAAVAKLG